MGLLRTPPPQSSQGVPPSTSRPQSQAAPQSQDEQPTEPPSPTHTVANTTLSTLPSPSRAFAPRRPGVMRSPPSSSSQEAGPSQAQPVYPTLPTPTAAPATITVNDEISMDIVEPSLDLSLTPSKDLTFSFDPTTPAQPNLRSIPPSAARPTATPAVPTSTDETASTSTSAQEPTAASHTVHEQPIAAPEDVGDITEDEVESDISMDDIPAAPVTPARTRGRSSIHPAAETSTPNVPRQAQPIASSSFVTPKPNRGGTSSRATRQSTAAEPSRSVETQAQDVPVSTTGEAVKEADSGVDGMEHGKRWKLTKDTIQLVADRVISKWTYRDLRKSMPALAAQEGKELEKRYQYAAESLKAGILREADKILEHYRVDRSLQLMDQVINDGEAYEKERKSDAGRIDAWRPDLTPAALTAATVLPVYDEAWERLRIEYLELYEDARKRYASISVKQAELKELEESVADGVIELDQTIKVLDGFPNEEMMGWTEDVAGRLAGYRDP